MRHLLICREYPPAPYPAGGIGTYARHIARLLAEAGETVHVVSQRWDGAPEKIARLLDGRLVVHRIALDEDLSGGAPGEVELLHLLAWSNCPSQVFSWQAARYAERLIEDEAIDLVEAQEWEAPLYYLQVRRALGLGPARQPPCIVHLHSPTAMIFQYNEWDTTLEDYLPLSRLEEYSIRAADALVCPSEYLARGVTELYGLAPGRIEVVRYPMGETEMLARDAKAWSRNAVCYAGRLELRKGVIEWVDAAVQVASTNREVSFDFFGSDTPVDGGVGRSVLDDLKRRIPSEMRGRFRFHGARSREELLRALAEFSIGVVPSRWENLPFTCIEAMATGLPVLVSPCGGMAELVEDGLSGWVASNGSADALAGCLRRALATTAIEREQVGTRAAARVRRICGNDVVVARHLAFRLRVVERGAATSTMVPGSAAVAREIERRGVGVLPAGAGVVERAAMVLQQRALLGVLLAGDGVAFAEELRTVCAEVFSRQPGVGLVLPWRVTEGGKRSLDAGPGPISAGEMQGELPAGCCVRVEALRGADGELLPLRWETLAAGGWSAVTVPRILVTDRTKRTHPKRRYSGMALIQNQTPAFALAWFRAAPLQEKLRWIWRVIARPGRMLRWLGWQMLGGAK